MSTIKYEHHVYGNELLPFSFSTQSLTNKKIYPHAHKSIELLHCTNGSGSVTLDDETLSLSKGETAVANSKALHMISSQGYIEYFCIIINQKFLEDNGIDINNTSIKNKFHDATVDILFNNINSAYIQEENRFSVALKRAAVLNLLIYVYTNHSSTQNTRSIKNLKSYEAILNAVEYISAHFSEKLALDDICCNSGYSKYHFSRIFKEYTGYTVMNYLTAVRCDNARHLLKENMPISKVSYECGFENCSLFAKEFKRHFQLLPSEYRKIKQKRT